MKNQFDDRATTPPSNRVPAMREVHEAEWPSFADQFSSLHKGKPAVVETSEPNAGTQMNARHLPLMGIRAEPDCSGGTRMGLLLGDSTGAHLAHDIGRRPPTQSPAPRRRRHSTPRPARVTRSRDEGSGGICGTDASAGVHHRRGCAPAREPYRPFQAIDQPSNGNARASKTCPRRSARCSGRSSIRTRTPSPYSCFGHTFRTSYVRAKVNSILEEELVGDTAAFDRAMQEAAAYYTLAWLYTRPRAGRILLMCALSGAGKSTVARA